MSSNHLEAFGLGLELELWSSLINKSQSYLWKRISLLRKRVQNEKDKVLKKHTQGATGEKGDMVTPKVRGESIISEVKKGENFKLEGVTSDVKCYN